MKATKTFGAGKPPLERAHKTCPVCQRPFAWRKAWAKNWDSVVYCSERCRQNRNQGKV